MDEVKFLAEKRICERMAESRDLPILRLFDWFICGTEGCVFE
jgi:hypothetical protein